MISSIVALLRPLFLPLLKLDLRAPHLPEGVSLVRHLKPAAPWLGLKYAGVLLGFSFQLLAMGGALAGAMIARQTAAVVTLSVVLSLALLSLGFALVTARIDFELRHYLVGDRSLRVSQGALVRREVTISYANVQNLEVFQGPLERLFHIKSLIISTAGGTVAAAGQPSSHQVVLAGIVDADAVRELILGMVKQQRDAGLGEVTHVPEALSSPLLLEVRDAAVALKQAALSGAAAVAPNRP